MKKRRIAVVVATLTLLAVLIGTAGCKGKEDYSNYFKNFRSRGAYTHVEETLTLPEGVTVQSYDSATGYYIIRQKFHLGTEENPTEFTLYGIADAEKILVPVKYFSILGLRKDYAICVRLTLEGGIEQQKTNVGVVKITGTNALTEYGFGYQYAAGVAQYQFAGDYLAVHGDLNSETSDVRYATLYDLNVADNPMEVGRIGDVYTYHNHFVYDNYIISSYQNSLSIFDIDKISSGGFFVKQDEYQAFDDEDGFVETAINIRAYYVGNGWFIFSGVYSSSAEYDGYEIKDVQNEKLVYMTIKSVKYNARSKLKYSTYRTVTVANSYHDKEMRAITDTMNWQTDYLTDQVGTRMYYFQPVVPPSSMVKAGYSISYYYYFVNGVAMVSFDILDENCNSINLDHLLMPVLYVDGVGLQNSDPNFEIPLRALDVYSYKKGKMTTLRQLESKVGYDPAVSFGGAIMAYRTDLTSAVSLTGAVDADGTQLIPFRYYELTPFFGEYATASTVESPSGENPIRKFYRINRSGQETEIQNMFGICNGVYVTKTEKIYRLYANDGTLLIDNAENITVLDSYLIGDEYLQKTVFAVKNGKGVIYRIS